MNLAQLKEVGKLAKKHTTVSVGNNKADADDFLVKGGNLELKRHTTDGQANYDVALSKDVVLGKEGSLKAGNTTINNDGVETNKVKVGDITITDQASTAEPSRSPTSLAASTASSIPMPRTTMRPASAM